MRFARTALPLNFTTVRLAGVDNGANGVFTVREQHFTAEGNEHLTMEFALDDDARLEWTRAGGWTFSASAATPPAPLEPNAWPEFAR